MNSVILREFTGPLYPLLYENLLTDLRKELQNVFTFLNIVIDDTAIDCALINQEGNFHRKRKHVNMKYMFTEEMIRNITIAINDVSDILETKFRMRLNYSMPEY